MECDRLLRHTDAHPPTFTERFLPPASPGIIATIHLNAYYDSHERHVFSLAREMRKEYELVHGRGLLLQLDCPDLAMERARLFQHEPLDRFLQIVDTHVEAVNRATAAIPPERIRLHVCWGNYDGPHTHDVPLEPLLPHLYRARVGALSLPLANPRHQHEYKVLKRNPPPGTMLLLPGVIDSTTNYVEHPEVVADRICQAAEAVGDRTRIIASTDCGFGTFAGSENVAESVVWARLGKSTSHHRGTRPVIESASMLPQVGVGGGTPTPRKPSAASMTMATPRCVVASTRYGATHWGRTCRRMMRNAEAPLARPASTYAISRTVIATERITRPPKGMRVMAMATITAGSPVPMAMEMAMARIRSGNACKISMMRWLARSKRPPG